MDGFENSDMELMTNNVHTLFAPRKRVLLIDDDPVFCQLFVSCVDSAVVGIEAYESIGDLASFSKIGTYDLVVIDNHLPIMGGLEIAEYIDTFFPDLPVILISADDMTKSLQAQSTAAPQCIRDFVKKEAGVGAILNSVMDLVRLSWFSARRPATVGASCGKGGSGKEPLRRFKNVLH